MPYRTEYYSSVPEYLDVTEMDVQVTFRSGATTGASFDRGGRTATVYSNGDGIELTVIPPTEVEADGTATARICPTRMGEDDACGELTVRQLAVDEG